LRRTPSFVTRSRTTLAALLPTIEQVRTELCRSMFVTASRSTVASTVSTPSLSAPQLTSTRATMPAADSRDATVADSWASDMFR
jgi:hypothetical protein